MKLKELNYHSISDIAKRWSNLTGEEIDFLYVLEHIRQENLKVKTYYCGKYYDVPKSMLPAFDIRYIDASLVKDFGELKLTELNNPAIKEFEEGAEVTLKGKLKDVYVRHSDLVKFENNESTAKGLHTKIKNSYLRVILALVRKFNMDISENSHAVRDILMIVQQELIDIKETKIREIIKEARELGE